MIDFILLLVLLVLVLVCLLGISVLLAAFITGVPFVPTHRPMIQAMIEMADLKKGQTVYDLGSGLGHILFAVPNHVRRVGYERIIFLVWGSKIRNIIRKESVEFFRKDFFWIDFKEADVLFCYLFPHIMERFKKEIWPNLSSGCKVISHGFPLSEISYVEKKRVGNSTLYLYVKP